MLLLNANINVTFLVTGGGNCAITMNIETFNARWTSIEIASFILNRNILVVLKEITRNQQRTAAQRNGQSRFV